MVRPRCSGSPSVPQACRTRAPGKKRLINWSAAPSAGISGGPVFGSARQRDGRTACEQKTYVVVIEVDVLAEAIGATFHLDLASFMVLGVRRQLIRQPE
jgi:hypothetical protein